MTYNGERIKIGSGKHRDLMEAAIRAKIEQNPKEKEILMKTGDAVLLPDHIMKPVSRPFNEILMKMREETLHSK